MRLVSKILVGFFLAFLATSVSAATPQEEAGQKIHNFDVVAKINADSSVNITERIVYDFGTGEYHGIFREIPVKYETRLGNQKLRLSKITVTDDESVSIAFNIDSQGKYTKIKIGDPDVSVTGVKTYVISYTADQALGYFKDHDELYWNATGNGWQVPIESATFEIVFPFAAPPNGTFIASCYYGAFGSASMCENKIFSPSENEGITATFFAPHELAPGEGLTGAFGFPKGIVHEPSTIQNFLLFVRDNWILVLPLLVFGAMYYIWHKKGRDPQGRGTIIPEYDAPDGLSPLEISGLMHQGVRTKDISAEIILLATRGYLAIARLEEKEFIGKKIDYKFTKIKEAGKDLNAVETELLENLFEGKESVKMSELKNKFYTKAEALGKKTIGHLVEKGYYPEPPQKASMKYALGAVLIAIVSSLIAKNINTVTLISVFLSSAILLIFAFLMPKVTLKGAHAKEAVLGLKDYLRIAEKDRINFHNAPEKSPELFEKLLPFAMVLGVEKAWAKEFEDIYMTPPGWYSDPSGGAFNAIIFANNLSSFNSAVASNMVSAPGSHSGAGGGGFSGGGGGGGGGGSW